MIKFVRLSVGLMVALSIGMGVMVIVGRLQPAAIDVQAAVQENATAALKVGDVITQLGKPMCFGQVETLSRQPPIRDTSYDLTYENYIIIVDSPHAFSAVREIIPVSGLYRIVGCYPTTGDESSVSSWSWRGFRRYGDADD